MSVWRTVVAFLLYEIWSAYTGLGQLISMIIGLGGVIAVILVGGHAILPKTVVTPSLYASFVIFFVTFIGLVGPTRLTMEHRYDGTLEQILLSPLPLFVLGIIRSMTSFLTFLPAFIGTFIGLYFFQKMKVFIFTPRLLEILVLLFIGSIGNGLLLGSIALFKKRAGKALNLVSLVAMIGSLVQIQQPGLVFFLNIVPFFFATHLAFHPSIGGMLAYVVTCLINLIVGIVSYVVTEKRVVRNDGLAKYI